MTIISFEHKFIFVKTRKVASTSIEVALRAFLGADDIATFVTPRDEYYAANHGLHSKNYAENPADEAKYLELVLDNKFDEAMRFIKDVDKKYTGHMRVGKLKAILEKDGHNIDDFFLFTVERHPYSWVLSRAMYNNTKYNQDAMKDRDHNAMLVAARKVLDKPNYNWDMYTIKNKVAVDEVIRYEMLEEELPKLIDQLGLDSSKLELPDLKKNSRHLSASELFPDDMKREIRQKFSNVFDLLDYSE